ncbi:MAG: AbrB/MazE/SpoVT family DNA-binding domain-containing protein [Acidobacteriota bacterium]
MEQITAKLTEGGRLVIPSGIRKEMNLAIGDEVVMIRRGNELVILSRKEAVRKAQALVRKKVKPGRSLVNELLSERKEESARE